MTAPGSDIPGAMQETTLQWLYDHAKQHKYIIELGSWMGRSTTAICLGRLAADNGGHVWNIDPWSEAIYAPGYEAFYNHTRKFRECSILTTHRMTSEDAAHSILLPPMVDMIFFDGDHHYPVVIRDLEIWGPRSRRLLCGHDYDQPSWPGVKQAVDEYFGAGVAVLGPDYRWEWKRVDSLRVCARS